MTDMEQQEGLMEAHQMEMVLIMDMLLQMMALLEVGLEVEEGEKDIELYSSGRSARDLHLGTTSASQQEGAG